VKIVNGIVIPDLLDLHLSEDAQAYPTYWLLERYFTGPWDSPTVDTLIEPIRAKVEPTQDLSQLDETDERIVTTLNALYNSDFDAFSRSTGTSLATFSPGFPSSTTFGVVLPAFSS
jgi:hypothetical protein